MGLAYVKLKQWPEAVETFAEWHGATGRPLRRLPHALALFNAGSGGGRGERGALADQRGRKRGHTRLGVILDLRATQRRGGESGNRQSR